MSRPSPLAAEIFRAPLLLIAALFAQVLAAPVAAAQSNDPFALPSDVTIADAVDLSGPGLSSIRVDGREMDMLVRLAWIGEVLNIDADDARAVGLPVDAEMTGYVPVEDIYLASWDFSQLDQTLLVKKFRKSDGPNWKDFSNITREDAMFRPMTAFLFDYDLTGSAGGSGSYGAGSFNARLTRGDMVGGTAFRVLTDPGTGYDTLTRLATAASFADRERGVTWTAGDHISVGSNSMRALRLAGIQFASDFALRPGLIAYPLPAFDGQVAVPTGIDLIINDKRFSAGELEAGTFAVRNVPVSPGRGEVSVVLLDELGRERVETTQLYVSRELLREGLWEGGVNIGAIRRNFGKESGDYRDLALTFLYRRGVSDHRTIGASGELGAGIVNLGAHAETALGGVALATAELRASGSGSGAGALIRLGVESIGRGLSGRIEGVLPTKNYRDLASASGDALPVIQLNAMVNFDITTETRLLFSASHVSRHYDPRYPALPKTTKILRANTRTSIAEKLDAGFDLAWRRGSGSQLTAMLGLMYRFGERTQAMASVQHANSRIGAQATLQRPDVQPGDFGYGLEATHSISDRFSGRASYRTAYTRVEGQAEMVGGRSAVRGNLRGTLVATGGTVFARNQTGGAYAFVKTGNIGGITVTRENRFAGVSDSKGRVLVEQITPLVPVQFDIDPDELPADAVARSTYSRVAVARGSVGRVEMNITAFRSMPLRLVDVTGKALPLGMMLTSDGGVDYMVGYDGLIDFNALSGERELVGALDENDRCRVALPRDFATTGLKDGQPPELVAKCDPGIIAIR